MTQYRWGVTVGLSLLVLQPVSLAPVARADEPPPNGSKNYDARPVQDAIVLSGEAHTSPRTSPGQRPGKRSVVVAVAACGPNNPNTGTTQDLLCPGAVTLCQNGGPANSVLYWFFSGPPGVVSPVPGQWRLTSSQCLTGDQVPGGAVPGFSAADFRRLPLPAGIVLTEPVDHRTLINIETNVLVQAPPVVLTTTLLGLPVRVRATAARYRWTFGDGASLDTAGPGAHYPDLRTTHIYLAPGIYTLGLTTTYRGEYSVRGGPWIPIDGTAQVTSLPVQVTAYEARAHLIVDPDASPFR